MFAQCDYSLSAQQYEYVHAASSYEHKAKRLGALQKGSFAENESSKVSAPCVAQIDFGVSMSLSLSPSLSLSLVRARALSLFLSLSLAFALADSLALTRCV